MGLKSLLALKTLLPNQSPKFSLFYLPRISKDFLNTCLITFRRPVSVLNLPTNLQDFCHALGSVAAPAHTSHYRLNGLETVAILTITSENHPLQSCYLGQIS